ncbi:hypothetical protein [Terrabacter carboxydivorans]|uniref:Uncharacterized protein n=1 Tax=Terrabacter carboxydivorans TaxID=619730 RepID=A0ABN3MCD4_9MICO
MSTVPRALRRARLWTAGLMTAATVLVGAVGIHLADAQNQTVATQTTSQTSSQTTSQNSSDDSSSSTSSGSSDDSASTSGFSAVAPVSGSNAQAQTNSGGS